MKINNNHNNKTVFNTFGINIQAYDVLVANTEKELLKLWQQSVSLDKPVLILGGGSNILFLEKYTGIVLLNRIRGISFKENNQAWYIHIGAGEIWHDLVTISLNKHIPGLENLALIPGYVGAAPIQNIGAYGVELQQLCEYVDILELCFGKKQRLSVTECQFSYRKSIFKYDFKKNYAIVAVGLKLTKTWQPMLNYGDLINFHGKNVTPRQIYNKVCAIRRNKLPDPNLIGNAGSFFKNPIIELKKAKKLITRYPNAPYYKQSNNKIKFIAGWLIEQCGLKNYQFGGAAIYEKNLSVLINTGKATSTDVVFLAKNIRKQVIKYFTIWLEPEVHFIGATGEVDSIRILS